MEITFYPQQKLCVYIKFFFKLVFCIRQVAKYSYQKIKLSRGIADQKIKCTNFSKVARGTIYSSTLFHRVA